MAFVTGTPLSKLHVIDTQRSNKIKRRIRNVDVCRSCRPSGNNLGSNCFPHIAFPDLENSIGGLAC
ncbi:hypothetical protein [Pseudophaeobacter sp.]|uniref:hypothetical protein n=1 Tax=Pseudophaeobacter sp. TaxID=1971739 RepID=UPI004058ED7C